MFYKIFDKNGNPLKIKGFKRKTNIYACKNKKDTFILIGGDGFIHSTNIDLLRKNFYLKPVKNLSAMVWKAISIDSIKKIIL